jgi:uncharacterized membrane protein YfcA
VTALVGGAIGLVLGSLRLPALLVAAASPATAAGTNIAVSASAALTAGATHARAGRVDWRIAAWMTPPSVLAAFLGGYFGGIVPDRVLLLAIAVVLIWNGTDLLLELRAPRRAERPWLAAVVAGCVIGLLGGAVGLILGTLRMPALLGSVGVDVHRAVGTNLLVGFFLGISGLVGHALRDEVDWRLLVVCATATVPAAWWGARLTGMFSAPTIKRALGAALLAVAAAVAVAAFV